MSAMLRGENAVRLSNLHRILWAVAFLWFLSGCVQAISKEVLDEVDPAATFKAVFHDPDSYKGKTVLWGGKIIQARNKKNTTWIELLQQPLGRDDRPIRGSESEGRFLIRHEGFLDPAVYGRGRDLTVVGEIQGRETRPLDEVEFSYPVVSDKQLVLWGPHQESTIHFGLGVGATFSR
ncbi:MAG TPA: Slp family lipoprotein [Nitrospiria bacterium]|jgi:outer membrane lipoprotein|nr:Slp family lipoprotein [Nitrospiria bacterium]